MRGHVGDGKTTVVAEYLTGARYENGTEWPIANQVTRWDRSHIGMRPRWTLIRGLCNGVPDSGKDFKTKREALEAFGHGRPTQRGN